MNRSVCCLLASVLLVFSADAHAQFGEFLKIPERIRQALSEKYKAWVFFTTPDQGNAFVRYNQRSLERRKKMGLQGDTNLDRRVDPHYRRQIEQLGAKVRVESRWFNAVSVEASGEILLAISDLPFVMRVEFVEGGKIEADPIIPDLDERTTPIYGFHFDDGKWSKHYGWSREQLEQIFVPELHDAGLSGKGVTVCLMDSGFDWSHPAFHRIKLLGQWDFVMNDGDVRRNRADPNDFDDDHGTMALSVVGGYAPGKVIGPAFGADYLLAKTEDIRSETPIEEDYWVAGLEWCEAAGADIISSSLGYRDFDDPSYNYAYDDLDGRSTRSAIAANFAAEQGVLVITSVGNSGEKGAGSLSTPADSLGVLSVGAVYPDGGLAYFSSQGPTADGRIKPEVVARGVRVAVARREEYSRASGTSFAAPLVAGAAALILEANPEWNVHELRQALLHTASHAERPDNRFGYGVVDALRAIAFVPTVERDYLATHLNYETE